MCAAPHVLSQKASARLRNSGRRQILRVVKSMTHPRPFAALEAWQRVARSSAISLSFIEINNGGRYANSDIGTFNLPLAGNVERGSFCADNRRRTQFERQLSM